MYLRHPVFYALSMSHINLRKIGKLFYVFVLALHHTLNPSSRTCSGQARLFTHVAPDCTLRYYVVFSGTRYEDGEDLTMTFVTNTIGLVSKDKPVVGCSGSRFHMVNVITTGSRFHMVNVITTGSRFHMVNVITTGSRFHMVNVVTTGSRFHMVNVVTTGSRFTW